MSWQHKVRRQAVTGKLILQVIDGDGKAHDCFTGPEGAFHIVPPKYFDELLAENGQMKARIAKYEKRAQSQRDARKARAQPKESTT